MFYVVPGRLHSYVHPVCSVDVFLFFAVWAFQSEYSFTIHEMVKCWVVYRIRHHQRFCTVIAVMTFVGTFVGSSDPNHLCLFVSIWFQIISQFFLHLFCLCAIDVVTNICPSDVGFGGLLCRSDTLSTCLTPVYVFWRVVFLYYQMLLKLYILFIKKKSISCSSNSIWLHLFIQMTLNQC